MSCSGFFFGHGGDLHPASGGGGLSPKTAARPGRKSRPGRAGCWKALRVEKPRRVYPQGVRRIRKAAKSPTAAQPRPQARKNGNLFSPATCASEKTLLRPQVWDLSASGGQILRAADCILLEKVAKPLFRQFQRRLKAASFFSGGDVFEKHGALAPPALCGGAGAPGGAVCGCGH